MKPNQESKIYVAGHRGLVGSAIIRAFTATGYTNTVTKTREELNLLDTSAVQAFFESEKPEFVIDAAAKVGGIMANISYPADFIYQNLQIQNNIIHAAHEHSVAKLLFLGSSCIYPKLAPQPMKEEYILTGPLEEQNYAYAVAKIAGIAMCESYRTQYGDNFISAMPTNVYGPGDNFDLKTSHVLPALIRKFDEAKKTGAPSVTLWGSGSPMREFMYIDDLAEACIFLLLNYNEKGIINVGTGEDVTIKDAAEIIKKSIGFEGTVEWDTSKPDGTPRKLLDVSKLHALGFTHKVSFDEGIKRTYDWYKENAAH